MISKVKQYLAFQVSKPFAHLLADVAILGSLIVCVYFGFIR